MKTEQYAAAVKGLKTSPKVQELQKEVKAREKRRNQTAMWQNNVNEAKMRREMKRQGIELSPKELQEVVKERTKMTNYGGLDYWEDRKGRK